MNKWRKTVIGVMLTIAVILTVIVASIIIFSTNLNRFV